MARGTGKPTKTFRMTPLGDRGPTLRPELDYFSVALVAVHLPGSLLTPRSWLRMLFVHS